MRWVVLRPRSGPLRVAPSSCRGSARRRRRRRCGGRSDSARYIIERMAIVSPPSASVTTTGRLTIAPVPRMATCGWLMIGVSKSAPRLPVLVMVKVPPARSSGVILLLRVRAARSAIARASPAMLRSPAFLTTGTMRPFSVSTAIDEVLAAVVDDLVALDARVDHRVRLERLDGGEREERQEAELRALAGLEVALDLGRAGARPS